MHQIFMRILKKLLPCLFLLPINSHALQDANLFDYIDTYQYIAIAEMRESGIPASIKMAQAILESGFGNSELAVFANNHFGIKCHEWSGDTYYYDDDAPNECFRLYDDPVNSFLDHTAFLTTRPRYAFLFELGPTDYEAWAYGLSQAGYATNPNYPSLLIGIIERYDLDELDKKAMDDSYELADHQWEGRDNRTHVSSKTEENQRAPIAIRGNREILSYNRINYVVARAGDTPKTLARDLDMRRWQIVRYNDLKEGDTLEAGQRVYIQPKRRRGEEKYHIAKKGDTMADISQKYGIRIENLYRRNDMKYGMEPEPGQKILLRGYKGLFVQYLFRRP
ncbi:MAG: glucosaminidase domain-containing protein [Bacteroidales bacterium]